MKIPTALLLSLFSSHLSSSIRTSRKPGSCSFASHHSFPPKLSSQCTPWELDTASPSQGHSPWTHPPYCVPSTTTQDTYCVFTNEDYHFGQGISIVTKPDVAAKLVSEGLLSTPPYIRRSTPETTGHEARYIPGVGIGLFVKDGKEFKAGENVMVDYPTLVVPSRAAEESPDYLREMQWRAVLQLGDYARRRSRDLAKSKGRDMDEVENVVGTNAFTHEKGDDFHDILFTEVARINHDCRPNAFTRTNLTTFAMEVIALRDLRAGEEIFISYLDTSAEMTSWQRRQKISSEWNFECSCSICKGPEVTKSDARRRRITYMKEQLYAAGGDVEAILKFTTMLLDLYEEEEMVMPLAEYYQLAAYAANRLEMDEEAVEYANLARRHWKVIFGEESQEVKEMDALARDPEGHSSREGPRV